MSLFDQPRPAKHRKVAHSDGGMRRALAVSWKATGKPKSVLLPPASSGRPAKLCCCAEAFSSASRRIFLEFVFGCWQVRKGLPAFFLRFGFIALIDFTRALRQ
jgi:hypothetical protein